MIITDPLGSADPSLDARSCKSSSLAGIPPLKRLLFLPRAEIALQHSAHVLSQVDTIITEIDEVALIAVGCADLATDFLESVSSRSLAAAVWSSCSIS